MTKKERFYFTNRKISPLILDELCRLNKKKNKYLKILDVGCGDGVMIFDLQNSKLLKDKYDITGIDISKTNIAIAKTRIKNSNLLVADACKLPFKNQSFDFVYSWMVIEHLSKPQKILTEIRRVMKLKSRCYISTIMRDKRAIYFYRRNKKFVLDPTHLHEFQSKEEFCQLLHNTGLKIIDIRLTQRTYSLLELMLKILIRKKVIPSKLITRDIFGKNIFLSFLQRSLTVQVPNFYQLEALCEKIL